MFGMRFEYDDPKLVRLLELMHKVVNNARDGKYVSILYFVYNLRYLPIFSGAYERFQERLRERKRNCIDFLKKYLF